jgi:hypothetical protein
MTSVLADDSEPEASEVRDVSNPNTSVPSAPEESGALGVTDKSTGDGFTVTVTLLVGVGVFVTVGFGVFVCVGEFVGVTVFVGACVGVGDGPVIATATSVDHTDGELQLDVYLPILNIYSPGPL